ncbi:tRNA pseudouridine synthase B [Fructobacillus pseudoficulneus]|uniref:tRNA pseudouridine synthase B n=1 Tax=Fructobacillus pseudoficulneus TaxID=220714 RepID=A0A3F3H210_9LACO|nr:tRNA pseudouridine(55) synthase TruB [Fructobacillus pseudoficulneus]GAP02618.1 tRNA pseudouridine synthase B [Fructobacillus pseudoficulneus]SEH38600.1 tRNA pseudouridine55 synthase [Fructobacillus pseudoficulneus]
MAGSKHPELSGLLVVNKPKEMTSFGVVARLRRVTGQKKIGHAGTLDPNVEGVLVVALGKATKLIDLLQSRPKTYTGTVAFGFATETQDADGAVVAEQALTTGLDETEIKKAMASLTGDIIQIPPIYSAVKVNGKRLYEYVRAGEEVELPKRPATIYRFEATSPLRWLPNQPYQAFDFVAQVSKGTYIRTLAYDLGQKLGLPATMTALKRTAGSGYSLDQATDLDDLLEMNFDSLCQRIQPIESVLTWPKKDLTEAEAFAVRNGQKITIDQWPATETGYYQLYDQGQLVAVYAFDADQDLWRSRYFFA